MDAMHPSRFRRETAILIGWRLWSGCAEPLPSESLLLACSMGLFHLRRPKARPVRAAAWLVILTGAATGSLNAAGGQGQDETPARSAPAGQVTALQVTPSSGTGASEAGVAAAPANSERTELNLLGGSGRRVRGEPPQRERPTHACRQQRSEGTQHPHGYECDDCSGIRRGPRVLRQRIRQSPVPTDSRSAARATGPSRLPLRDPRE